MNARVLVVTVLAVCVGTSLLAVPAAAQSIDDPFGDQEFAIGDEEDVPGELRFETDNGTKLVVDGVVTGGHATVECLDGESQESYCDKDGELYLGPGALNYTGYNNYDGANRTGGFGDTFAVTQDGEEVAIVDATMQDGPIATLIGILGGIGFGLFG